MEIRLACVEDGLENYGFRKVSAFIKSIHPQTKITYVPTGNLRSILKVLTEKGAGELLDKDISEVSQFLAEGDLIGFSSMTQYSKTVHQIISEYGYCLNLISMDPNFHNMSVSLYLKNKII